MSTSPAPVVLITGASRGIGAATALAFARAGWQLALTARSRQEGQALAHQLRRPDGSFLKGSLQSTAEAAEALGASVWTQAMDLLDTASLDAAIDGALAHYGRIDLLINNAVYQDRDSNAMLADATDESLARSFAANVIAPTRLMRRLLPVLLAQGGGQIINVSSGAGRSDPPIPANKGGWGFAYGASKAALARLAGCVNVEYAGKGITAYTVNPGLVSTEAVTATLGDGGVLEQRFGAFKPEVIARALLWLATSPDAKELAKSAQMIELQKLVKERGL